MAGSRKAVGSRFVPTDEELVGYYLINRIMSGTACFNDVERSYVKECDLYGSLEPWQVWDMYGGRDLEESKVEALYFFTRQKKVSMKGSRISRRVGCLGTWAGEDSGEKIIADDVVGFKKRFRYENPDSPHNGAWIMHEFVIDKNEIVLCRLKRNEIMLGPKGAEKRRKANDSCKANKKKRKLREAKSPNSEQQSMQPKGDPVLTLLVQEDQQVVQALETSDPTLQEIGLTIEKLFEELPQEDITQIIQDYDEFGEAGVESHPAQTSPTEPALVKQALPSPSSPCIEQGGYCFDVDAWNTALPHHEFSYYHATTLLEDSEFILIDDLW